MEHPVFDNNRNNNQKINNLNKIKQKTFNLHITKNDLEIRNTYDHLDPCQAKVNQNKDIHC